MKDISILKWKNLYCEISKGSFIELEPAAFYYSCENFCHTRSQALVS